MTFNSDQINLSVFDSTKQAKRVDVVSGSNLYFGLNQPATADTATPLAASQEIKKVTITALKTNTGSVYVGDSSVSSSNYGVELAANGQITLEISDLSLVFISVSVANEGVSFIAS